MNPSEREDVDRAIAWTQSWITHAEQLTSATYTDIDAALLPPPATRPFTGTFGEWGLTVIASHFGGLQPPPAAPTNREKQAVAAIRDRYVRMYELMMTAIAMTRKPPLLLLIIGESLQIGVHQIEVRA